jgi:hypothetical protein
VKAFKEEFKEYKESEEYKERSKQRRTCRAVGHSASSVESLGEGGRSSGKTRRMRC